MADTYRKSKGNAGLHGVQFQLNLLTVSLLNALHDWTDWKISTENEEAGKYDDIVIELPDESAVLIQSKHKDNRKINKDQLLSHNSKNADFSLPKYFFSYEEIKNKFKTKTVIICTNTNVDQKGLEDVITSQSTVPASMLHHEGCAFLAFNENILSELKASAEIYYEKNLQGKGIDRKIITEENVRDFLKNLQFFSNYPSGEKLDKIIGQSLSRLKNSTLFCNTSSLEVNKKVADWFIQPRGEYLTEVRAKAMFCEMKSEKYCDLLHRYNLLFKHDDFNFTDSKRIYQVKTPGGHLLQMLKIYRALQADGSRKLFINPDEGIEVQNQIIEAFELRHYTFLIMVWGKTTGQISDKLEQILQKDRYKKVILVSDDDDDDTLSQHFGSEVVRVDGCVTFKDLLKESQKMLLKSKSIVFQDKLISLEELFEYQTVESYAKSINSGILETIIRGKEIKIGVGLSDLNEDTNRYYINRTFVRGISKMESEARGNSHREDPLSEESIYDVNEKMIVISDSAGMGKSTVLTKLATFIKKKHPHLWVIKLNLNDYTNILKEFLKKNMKAITAVELLNSQEATKLTSEFEEFTFSTNGKIVFMLDGVDEISPDYTDLILNLLRQCQEASNFVKIFVTTRPHVNHEVERFLKVVLFKMIPFTRANQIDFLTRYWMHNLQFGHDENKEKCLQYANALIDKMFSWVRSYHFWERTFTAIPLQVRMLAEIFQESIRHNKSVDWEGCREFLNGDWKEPKLPDKINIAELYDMFIKKKRDVFVDKGSSSGNTTANQALNDKFDECLDYHRGLALKTILIETQSNLFSCCHPYSKNMELYALKMGIVQRSFDEFQFLHRTFAEYFVAQSILEELEVHNPNVNFQIFLIDIVLVRPQFRAVRAFFDRFLQKSVDDLPSNIFKSYQYQHRTSWMLGDSLISVVSEEGCLAIFRLILKSIHFKVSRSRKDKLIEFFNMKYNNKNTLNYLHFMTLKCGLDIRDKNGNMPLHYAVKRDHLEMVMFLVDQGADVNSENSDGATALHLAAASGLWETVIYLVEHGADVNSKGNDGRTVLHLAASFGNWTTVNHLLKRGARIDSRDRDARTLLHLAAGSGNLDAVRLLVKCGIDVNSRDGYRRTVLHVAARCGSLSTIKYLVGCGADVNGRDGFGKTVLHFAAEKGKIDIIEYLIERGADINSASTSGRGALHAAASFGNLDVVKYLVECGTDINSKDSDSYTVLHLAVKSGSLETVRYLAESGVDVTSSSSSSSTGTTILHLAAEKGKVDIVEYLIERGVDVNCKDKNGRTALYLAVKQGSLDTVKCLVERGADIDSKDNSGCTVLHLAVRFGNMDTIRYLVELGADVNSRDGSDHSISYVACEWRQKSVVEYLQGVGVNRHSGE